MVFLVLEGEVGLKLNYVQVLPNYSDIKMVQTIESLNGLIFTLKPKQFSTYIRTIEITVNLELSYKIKKTRQNLEPK